MAQPSSRDNMRKQFAKLRKSQKETKFRYPNCHGTFSDCPKESFDVTSPPDICKSCPIYKDRPDKFRTTNSMSEIDKLKMAIKRIDMAIPMGLAKEEDKKEFVDKLKRLEER